MRKRLGLPDLNVWVIRCIHGFSLEISSVRYIYTSKKLRTFVNLLIRRAGLFAYLFLTIVFGFLHRAFVQLDYSFAKIYIWYLSPCVSIIYLVWMVIVS